jgi:hypothetical protein
MPPQPQVPTRVSAQIPTRVPAQIPTRVPAHIATQPDPSARPAMIPATTMALDASDLSDLEEMTAITQSPFDADATGDRGLDYGDYEPTMLDRVDGDRDADDNPTITRDGAGVPLPQPVALSSSETMPRPHNDLRSKIQAGARAHPALAASTPVPAVSEVRRPRGSRRTPPRGVSAHGSVLRAIVGAAPGDAMPTTPIRSPAAMSDGVPRAVGDPASSNAPADPHDPPAGGAAAQPIPGHYQVPTAYGPPDLPPQQAMPLVAPPTPFPGSIPAAQLPPHLVQYGAAALPPPAQVVSPYPSPYPSPYGQAPASFTRQMQAAIELDDIPDRYKFQEARSRRIVWAIVILSLFIGGVALSVFLTRQSEAIPSALVVESTPPGATVWIDGVALDDPTPVRFPTRPGARHDIEVKAPGHAAWKEPRLMPSGGGELKVQVILGRATGRLRIRTDPDRASIVINGVRVGETPKTVTGLDPEQVKEVELVLDPFRTIVVPLDWARDDDGTIDIHEVFRK